MKYVLILVICVPLLSGMAGCVAYRAPVIPPVGGAFNQTSVPMDITYRSTAVGNKETKVGKASSVSVLSLFAFGDASTAAAARDGNITKIRYADSKLLNVLGLFVQHTTVVFGE